MLHLPICVTFLKNINFPKWSCVLNCFSKCPGVFVTDAKMDNEDDADLPFIRFYHYENISSCSLHKQPFSDNGKTCTSCMNIENFEKGKVTTRKSLVLESCSILDFHSEYYTP